MRTSAQWLQICGFCAPNMQTPNMSAGRRPSTTSAALPVCSERASERASYSYLLGVPAPAQHKVASDVGDLQLVDDGPHVAGGAWPHKHS